MVTIDDPFSSFDTLDELRTPETSRKFTSPLKEEGGENLNPGRRESTSKSPIRKRTSVESSSLTPLQQKVGTSGVPLLKRSSISRLADGFRTAASLTSESAENSDDDPFMLTFRQSFEKKTSPTEIRTNVKSPILNKAECLPSHIMSTYKSIKKLKNLYDWQNECLTDQRLLNGQNCILSLPTGAGKTLIAEILMLREAIVNKRNAILVLPYVAIVQEKMSALAPFEEAFGINIEEYASNKGRFPPINRRKRASVYIATIEKANMLINSLISQDRLHNIGLVIVDELHMIGDGGRGAIMEQMLTKYLYKGCGQIVGMSATLPNLDDLRQALRAYCYSTNFRPVALTEFVKIEQTMFKVTENGELQPSGDLPPNKLKTDPDGICQLLAKLVPKNSAVIFCPNKKNCENVAVLIAKSLPSSIRQEKRGDRVEFLNSMLSNDEDEKLDPILRQCLLSGVAYHHSGLTQDERKCVEAAFAENLIYVVCATSTLAAGVNLPVRRVIIKSPMVGREKLGKAQYMQMAGRAGRAGFDTKGDCITIVRKGEEERWFRKMLQSEIPRCISALSSIETMSSFLLDLITMKIAKNGDECVDAVKFSLLATQQTIEEIEKIVDDSLKSLETKQFVRRHATDQVDVRRRDDELTATDLGNAVFNAGFEPSEAIRLHTDLVGSLNQGVIFSSHFHLLFIITPYEQRCQINWDLFLQMYNALPSSEKTLLAQCGLSEKFILEAIFKRVEQEAGSPRMRLYIAMMLQKIWNHEPMWQVAERFQVEKGWLQATLQSSISQAASIAKFSEKINNMWPLRQLLPELVQRLAEAAQPELLPLMSIEGVKKSRASLLYTAGFKTVKQVAEASEQKLMEALGVVRRTQARSIITAARTLIRDRIDEKMEELEEYGIEMM